MTLISKFIWKWVLKLHQKSNLMYDKKYFGTNKAVISCKSIQDFESICKLFDIVWINPLLLLWNRYGTSLVLSVSPLWIESQHRAESSGYKIINASIVLNDSKKPDIIGYQFKKGSTIAMQIAARVLVDETSKGGGRMSDAGLAFLPNTEAYHKLNKAKVLDIWFEPVYEVPEQIVSMGEFNLTVRNTAEGKRVIHKNGNTEDDITNYVKAIVEIDKFIPIHIAQYATVVQDIIFSKTGCQNKPSKLSDWRKLYEIIK